MTKLETLNAELKEIRRSAIVLQEQLDAAHTIEKRLLWDILVETNRIKYEERTPSAKAVRRPTAHQIKVLEQLVKNGYIVRRSRHTSGTLFFEPFPGGSFGKSTDIVAKATIKALFDLGYLDETVENADYKRYQSRFTYTINYAGRAYLASLKK
jgi:hypothetical protein